MRRYLVLARRQYVDALSSQGLLEVADGQDPAAVARDRFGSDWLELVLAPVTAVHWVVRPGASIEATA